VTENAGGGEAVEVTTRALTTVDIDRVLGFEATTVSDWSIIQSGPGTLGVSTTASQASRSLAVPSMTLPGNNACSVTFVQPIPRWVVS
jgi:hypothetical protein